tara:strand:- start:774 stop:1004 length:231 start_codon:yes stop_codon:yes gene_type:complete
LPESANLVDPDTSSRQSVVVGNDGAAEQPDQGNAESIVHWKFNRVVGVVNRNDVSLPTLCSWSESSGKLGPLSWCS